MKLKYYGHACFSLSYSDGTTLVTDPFDPTVGYALCDARAHAVLISHDHFDHNYCQSLQEQPVQVRGSGERSIGCVRIEGIGTFHDGEQGALRGTNTVFLMEGDGLCIAHLGDLGHLPDEEQLNRLKRSDVLLIPIGGTYTITTPQALELLQAAAPAMAIAMHYKTDAIAFDIADEQAFVQATGAEYIGREIEITPQLLKQLPGYAVMAYK